MIPEGMGNKWLFSLDECDNCNSKFSRYEGNLCASVGPILTLGGTQGKGNRVRQTGRSRGSHNIKHLDQDGKRRISINMLDMENQIEPPLGSAVTFGMDGRMELLTPAPDEKFVPRLAYKALAKIGLSILPDKNRSEFSKLMEWVNRIEDNADFPFLDVGISVGSLGNAPPLVSATLLRRNSLALPRPAIVFILVAGSLCWQIDLMPDTLDDFVEIATFGCINIKWTAVVGPSGSEQIRIEYSKPKHFDWSEQVSCSGVIQAIRYLHNSRTNQAKISVEWRKMEPRV